MEQKRSPGTPEDLFGQKARLLVAQMTYPELVNFLTQHRGVAEAERDLRDVGAKTCRGLLKLWKPKSRSVINLMKELLKVIWNGRMGHKVLERDSEKRPLLVEFIDKDCKLCKSEEEVLEVEGLHYCAAVSGFMEELLNHMAKKGVMKLAYKSCQVETHQSIGSGDKKCSHVCMFEY